MNVYSISPRWLNPNKLEKFLNILKVKTIISFVNEEELTKELFKMCGERHIIDFSKTPLLNYSRVKDNKQRVDNFLRQAVYAFISPISIPIIKNGQWTGECEVKDIYKESICNNPIFNLEKLSDPNVLLLHSNYKEGHPLYGIMRKFKKYIFDILDKYGKQIDYKQRISFVTFDEFLFTSRTGYLFLNPPLYNRCNNHPVCPMLVYIRINSKHDNREETLQDLFLKKGAKRAMERHFINRWNEETTDTCSNYDYGDSNDWGQEGELKEIYENGGDWILDT